MLISEIKFSDVEALVAEIDAKTRSSQTLEDVAQKFVEGVYEKLGESIILLRLFITVKQEELPKNMQSFTEDLARKANISMSSGSYALTLMGTVGKKPEWNDRAKSNGHVGIPLASAEFVDSIPMMSALLEQLGFKLGWTRGEAQIVAQKMGRVAGTFFVEDAATVKDSKDRLIIAAQDFVKEHGVKTVFGVGCGFSNSDRFCTVICFLNENISKAKAVWFQTLTHPLKKNSQGFFGSPEKFFK